MSHRIHLIHYLVLFLMLAFGLVMFFGFRWRPEYQFLVVIGMVAGYVIWGIIHHHLERRLSWGVITEYLLVGLVVICLFWLNLLG